MALTGKSKKDTYKDLLYLNNSNNGVPATTPTNIEDGTGNKTAAKISQDKVLIQPNTNNTTDAFKISDTGGDPALTVDTTNRMVKVNTTQDYANTQYQRFHSLQITTSADTWYPMSMIGGASAGINLGTSSSPATTLTADYRGVNHYWYIMDNITIDAIRVWHMGDDSSSSDTLKYQLFVYTVDTSGAGSGDLSSGVAHASSSSQSIDNVDMDTHTLSIATANIDAGKVALLCVYADDNDNEEIVLNKARHHFKTFFENATYHRNKKLGLFLSSARSGKKLIQEFTTD